MTARAGPRRPGRRHRDWNPTGPDGPASLALSADTVAFTALGQSQAPGATVYDGNGEELDDASVDWSTSDPGAAPVDGSGLGTATATTRSGC